MKSRARIKQKFLKVQYGRKRIEMKSLRLSDLIAEKIRLERELVRLEMELEVIRRKILVEMCLLNGQPYTAEHIMVYPQAVNNIRLSSIV